MPKKSLPKPRAQVVIKALDYHDCAKYIEQKLGKELRNYAGKTFGVGDDTPYWDFWHWVIDACYVEHNGTTIYLGTEQLDENTPEWVREIVTAFVEEFGDNQEYWVAW